MVAWLALGLFASDVRFNHSVLFPGLNLSLLYFYIFILKITKTREAQQPDGGKS